MKIFAGTASSSLSERICAHLGTACGNAAVTHFEDGEIRVQFQENIRGKDVFLVNSTSPPVNDHLIELLILIDAARRASAARITAVLPYFGYARQDRKVAPRAPITAKLVADLITAAGARRVLSMDLHAGQIQEDDEILELVDGASHRAVIYRLGTETAQPEAGYVFPWATDSRPDLQTELTAWARGESYAVSLRDAHGREVDFWWAAHARDHIRAIAHAMIADAERTS